MLVVVVVDGGKTETRLFFNQVPNVIELPGIKGQRGRTRRVKLEFILFALFFFCALYEEKKYSSRQTGLARGLKDLKSQCNDLASICNITLLAQCSVLPYGILSIYFKKICFGHQKYSFKSVQVFKFRVECMHFMPTKNNKETIPKSNFRLLFSSCSAFGLLLLFIA